MTTDSAHAKHLSRSKNIFIDLKTGRTLYLNQYLEDLVIIDLKWYFFVRHIDGFANIN